MGVGQDDSAVWEPVSWPTPERVYRHLGTGRWCGPVIRYDVTFEDSVLDLLEHRVPPGFRVGEGEVVEILDSPGQLVR